MAIGKGSIRVQCPACDNVLRLSGVRGTTTLNCPSCKTKIKVTAPATEPLGARPAPVLDDEEIDDYEQDIRFADRLPIIKNIVIKDLISLKKLFLVLLIIGGILAVVMIPQASSIERRNTDDVETFDPE
ncbi:MAG: hypothetical protein JSV49_03700, partial [Thermoplasmata archaeon]